MDYRDSQAVLVQKENVDSQDKGELLEMLWKELQEGRANLGLREFRVQRVAMECLVWLD